VSAAEGPAACPLCGAAAAVRPLVRAHGRDFLECGGCRLIHVPAEQRPTEAEERAHYASHRNEVYDPRYRGFLDRLALPLAERLAPGAEGLDFGCGPGPALARMLEERGFAMEVFDPFFAPHPEALRRDYDFVTCTETAEHFHHPGREFQRLDRLLRPGGWLGVMTEMPPDRPDLKRWRYARDPTHVAFYRSDTMRWIGGRFGWRPHFPAPNVVLFHKPPGSEWVLRTGSA
jgi:SAM-dependent methyltransferase